MNCKGKAAQFSRYSPSLTGRLVANGHPTAGVSLWQCEKVSHCALGGSKSCSKWRETL
ncbi:hypothetical protein [Nostoc sp.]|uniref:hypothetical protein n=1 Tax=Nostoc sp. TaxID=1180 RepID=UPI002FF6EA27